jgi:DNA-binding CsgD family transcriptional regulator
MGKLGMKNTQEELAQLSELIGLIYEGTTLPGRWTESILPAIARFIQAPACILFTSLNAPQNGGYFFSHNMAQDFLDLYMGKYIHMDVWANFATEKNQFIEGNIVTGEELVPREKLLQSVFYKEFLRHNPNTAQLLTGVIFGADSADSMPTVCSFFRGFHHLEFGERERERMKLILPHLSRSLGVMQRLHATELAATSTLDAFNRLSTGVLLTDFTGEIRFINKVAESMLNNGDGLRLSKRPYSTGLGQLTADSPLAQRALSAALRATLTVDPCDTEHFSDSVIIPRSLSKAIYTLQFSALAGQSEFGVGGKFAAIIFVTDNAQRVEVDPNWLVNAYGLTPTEARVAIVMLKCGATQEVADYCNISLNTVRTHVKQIYVKLGVDTRARFVKLMLGFAGIGECKDDVSSFLQ